MNLRNYMHSKCTWGYITLCEFCASRKDKYTCDEIKDNKLPGDTCEGCGKHGYITYPDAYKEVK